MRAFWLSLGWLPAAICLRASIGGIGGLSSNYKPRSPHQEVVSFLEQTGRVSLARVGDHLASCGVSLPDGVRLADFIAQDDETFVLSGKQNNRQVALCHTTTQTALVQCVSETLAEHGPMRSAELKVKLTERGRSIPGLSTLLRRHNRTFAVEDGRVSLRAAPPVIASQGMPERVMRRLQALDLPAKVDDLDLSMAVREVFLCDLDNMAGWIEAVVSRAVEHGDAVLLLFCSTQHNPRLSASTAERMQALAAAGRLRLVTPVRDTKNAADFVLSFWVGWLHAQLHADATFVYAAIRFNVPDPSECVPRATPT